MDNLCSLHAVSQMDRAGWGGKNHFYVCHKKFSSPKINAHATKNSFGVQSVFMGLLSQGVLTLKLEKH